jgi:hypothetical protein
MRALAIGAGERVQHRELARRVALLQKGKRGMQAEETTQESFTISGLSAPATGRIGFLYLLTDNAVQGSQIGIDSFVLTTVPEPPQFALLTVSGLAFVLIGLPKLHPARRIASVAPSALASFQLTFPRPRKLSLGYPRSRLRR